MADAPANYNNIKSIYKHKIYKPVFKYYVKYAINNIGIHGYYAWWTKMQLETQ